MLAEPGTSEALRFIFVLLGLYRDNGKENGNYHITIGYILGL